MTTARQLAEKGFKIFRAGVWKPRTKPGGFEGMGEAALPWLQRVKEETGMLVSTEVAMPKHVEASLKAGVDLLWVGARTTANPFAMQELADSLKGVDIPVLVKNPVNPDIELWIGALELSLIHISWEPSTADSPASTRKSTATLPCGTSPSNCIAVSPTCPSSATRATSADAAT